MNLLTKFLADYNKSGIQGSYRLTNFLSHKIKSLQNVAIKTESGVLFVDLRIPASHGILANPRCQSGEDKVMRAFVKKNETALDIGAHFGFYTLLLSKLVGNGGKVFAFEPNTELLPSLRQTISNLPNTMLFSIALSDKEGKTKLFIPEDASMASLSDWTEGIAGNVHQVECEMQKLDNLIEKENISIPSFIKCDVEGAELSIFKGASKTLDRIDAPVIMFEINSLAIKSFDLTNDKFFDFLLSLENPKYNFFEVTEKGISKLESKDMDYANIVAVPQAKIFMCDDILI